MALTSATLVDRIQTFVGWADDVTAEQALALEWLNDGYHEFLTGVWYDEEGLMRQHNWTFLKPRASMTLWGGFAAQALTVSGDDDTILTAATASFFATMVGATIVGDTSGTEYTVVTYTSTKIIVVDADASGDTTFTMTPNGVNRLPAGWGGSDVSPVYDNDESTSTALAEVSPGRMERLYRDDSNEGMPRRWCYFPATHASSAVLAQDIRVHPACDEDYLIQWPFRLVPADLADSATYHVAGVEHDLTIEAFAKAAAEFSQSGKHGAWFAEARRLMRQSAILDRNLKDSSQPDEGQIRLE